MQTGKGSLEGRGIERRAETGFTLIELVIVVAIIGILVSVAMPVYKNSVIKAREAVLREDLWVIRDCIDQYFTDKGQYPADLGALVETGYIKTIPIDPITNSAESWVTEEAPTDENAPDATTGIRDVKSGAEGSTIDGTPYSDL